MNTLDSGSRHVPEDDELDDILNGIVEGRDVPSKTSTQPVTQPLYNGPSKGGDSLGLDEEIVVTKKRIPIPKLDEHRLLSHAGVPKLKKISRERLRFKGKGHEVCATYQDLSRAKMCYSMAT